MADAGFQIGGYPVPIFFLSDGQAYIQVPWELAGQSTASAKVAVNGQVSLPQTVKLSTFAPGIFSLNAQGTGQGAIQDASYRLVDSSNPATVGSTVIIYCTGLGPVTNQPLSGSPAPSNPLAETTTAPTVTIGGAPATVLLSGLTPDYVGLYQVRAQVPAAAVGGAAVPVVLSIGGVTSNTVTIAVQSSTSPNPQPAITDLSPSSATAGTGPLPLAISGSGFIASSSVTFKGVAHAPSFVNANQLIITLSASDLAAVGGFPIVVTNPAPGGGVSNTVSFNVTPAPVGLTGTWSGAWGSVVVPSAYGLLSATLVQAGTSLTGSIRLDSVCFPGGPLSGTISGTNISAAVSISGIQLAALGGTVDATGNTINGLYSVLSGTCAGDWGVFTLHRVQ